MLCFDYLQPSIDGQPLAVVRYRLAAGEKLSAVGLVRCTPEVVAKFPKWSPRVKAYLQPYAIGQRPRAKFNFPWVDSHHAFTWEANGLRVIEHRPLYGYPGRREYTHQNFSGAMTELLQHPLWVSTGLAWEMRRSSSAAIAIRPRARL